MDSRLHSILLFLAVVDFLAFAHGGGVGVGGVGVIEVTYKFPGSDRSLSALRAHDVVRHLAILAGVDIPLGGTGRPDSIGLYYAKIGIGTPSKDYYVQVDTGSDITWVNCIQCHECPQRGYHGIELTLYDPNGSLTGKRVSCDHNFCKEIGGGSFSGCTTNTSCFYTEVYGDGSYSMGYFVEDIVIYDRVSGDLQTTSANGSVIFGCGARQSGDLGSSDDALDGILGFGKSNSSMISQLAASRRVKKMFAHCLDGVNGGGIFAIGHVVQPQVNTTPLVPDQPHYSVNMTAIQVGLDILNLTTDDYMINDKKGAIIDSGTTLAYLPQEIYVPLVKQILSWQPDLNLQTLHDQYTCFDHSGSLDDDFPPVVFHFENSLLLKVYPHEYLFTFEDLTCIGWQNSRYKSNITLLGDLVLSNKLVLYDLENQAIGWTEYNCSSTIKLKDELTGSVHLAFEEKRKMSYYEVDQVEYMVDDGDVTDSVDTIDEEYYTAEDANLDEYDMLMKVTDTSAAQARNGKDIQGIPWDRLNIKRESYRQTRLEQYQNYENLPSSGDSVDKSLKGHRLTEKGGKYFDFFHNTRLVKPTILHFQLRNLVWATSKHDVFLISNYSIMHWSSLFNNLTEVLNFSGKIVPTERNPGTLLEGFTQMQLSALAVKDRFMVVGGFHGELVCKNVDKPGVSFCARTTYEENAITNAIEIFDCSSGGLHFMASNNDCGVREYDMERFQLLNHFRFPWPVNHTSMNPDGKLLMVVGDDCDGILFDSYNRKKIASIVGHVDYSFASAWHPNGRIFATGNQDKTCRVWDLRKLSMPVAILRGNIGAFRSIHFSKDGKFIVVAEAADFVHVYNTHENFEKRQEIDLFGEISGVSLSPDDESLYIGLWDRTYASLLQYNRRHSYGYLDSLV